MILEALKVGEFTKQEWRAREESLEQNPEELQHTVPSRTIPMHHGDSKGVAGRNRMETRRVWCHGAKGRGFRKEKVVINLNAAVKSPKRKTRNVCWI